MLPMAEDCSELPTTNANAITTLTNGDDDENAPKDHVSSPASSPTSSSPGPLSLMSIADHAFTPLSMVDDSLAGASDSGKATNRFSPTSDLASEAMPQPVEAQNEPDVSQRRHSQTFSFAAAEKLANGGFVPENIMAQSNDDRGVRKHEDGHRPTDTGDQGPTTNTANNASSPGYDHAKPPSPLPPLRTGSVHRGTKIAHPRPINLTTTPTNNIHSPNEAIPDLNSRSGTHVGNVAQLEATAEELSRTHSIDHAIRDLHGELKRSDSKRSSILAASVRATSVDENPPIPYSSTGLRRNPSNASSILPTNIVARQGGYSPAGFVHSPNPSVTGRLRSGSKNSAGRPDIEFEPVLSRHGPGKASVRSVRSTKLQLVEISESDPVSLDQRALDAADAAPPIDFNEHHEMVRLPAEDESRLPNTDAFHEMLGNDPIDHGGSIDWGFGPVDTTINDRPSTSHSANTFQQAQDAFVDFDGVHWEPDEDLDAPLHDASDLPTPRPRPAGMERPQSYMDPQTGQQMLFYPAKVPAMLNLPPKLSSQAKVTERNKRHSQVLNAMMGNQEPADAGLSSSKRESAQPNKQRASWLPDPLAGQRESFIGLPLGDEEPSPEPPPIQGDADSYQLDSGLTTGAEPLRRPPRLSRVDPENRQSRMSRLDPIPPQLRASAYFDLPPVSVPDIEIKDGSAQATLDSILDASAVAPINAFTDHSFGGKLGTEVYGKEKKRKSQAAAATLMPVSKAQEPKKRSSFMWLGKRSSSYNSAVKSTSRKEGYSPAENAGDSESESESEGAESRPLTSSMDGQSVLRVDQPTHNEDDSEESEGSEEEDAYLGPPTTLLAELQLRKQQQKQRTQHLTRAFPNGMHATLLEMDAVAEAQRKTRQAKRVNLAWEDPDANEEAEESDDEDVPLAIIAAKNQGAKNMADLERPIGLMERRELEDNEPLSRRRARLHGQETLSIHLPARRSVVNLSAPMTVASRSPSPGQGPSPGPPEAEVEGETLGERKRRLAAKEEAEGKLPRSRPVSRAFSEELLSQFGDLDQSKEKNKRAKENVTPGPEGEETLAQRRARLQAEREAREREMSYSNLVGKHPPAQNRTMSMADVLSAYPNKNTYQHNRAPSQQHPTLSSQIVDRSGGFQGGAYNNGFGGMTQQARPTTNGFQSANFGAVGHNSQVNAAYGGFSSGVHQPAFAGAPMNGVLPGQGYGGVNSFGGFGNPGQAMSMYGANLQPGAMQPLPPNGGSMDDRVERWRQGVWR